MTFIANKINDKRAIMFALPISEGRLQLLVLIRCMKINLTLQLTLVGSIDK